MAILDFESSYLSQRAFIVNDVISWLQQKVYRTELVPEAVASVCVPITDLWYQ